MLRETRANAAPIRTTTPTPAANICATDPTTRTHTNAGHASPTRRSPDLAATAPDWRIWHPVNDPGVTEVPELADALLSASDHFPVTIDLEL